MNYGQQKTLAIGVTVTLGILAAIQVADAKTLGLSPTVVAWLGIISAGLGILSGFLPNVRGVARNPTFLEHRIAELPLTERKRLATRLANRAMVEERLAQADKLDDERRAEHAVERRLPHG